MATNPRLQPADLFTSTPQPVHRAAQRHTPQSHRLSGMTANTITAATIDGTCRGRLVTPDDGGSKGCPAMVLSVSGTTALLDRNLPSTDSSSVSMWMTGDMPVVATAADAAGSRDVIAAAYATASTGGLIADDYYNNEYQLACLTGLNTGRARTITDFVASTGQFVVGFPDDVADGDLFLLLRVDALEADVEMRVSPRIIERTFIGTGRIAAGVPVSISGEADAVLELGVKMLTASAGAGVQAGKPGNLNTYLEDCFDRHSDTGGAVVSANGSIVNLNSSVLSQGGFLLLNTGEVIHVLATDTGGVSPGTQDVAAYGTGQLTHASVQAGSDAYAFTWYSPKTQGPYRPRTLSGWRGGLHFQKLMGCMGSVELNIERDNIAKFRIGYMAPESVSYPLARPVALGATYPLQTFDSTIPTDPKHSMCLMDGVPIHISDLKVDFGFEAQIRTSLSGLNVAGIAIP